MYQQFRTLKKVLTEFRTPNNRVYLTSVSKTANHHSNQRSHIVILRCRTAGPPDGCEGGLWTPGRHRPRHLDPCHAQYHVRQGKDDPKKFLHLPKQRRHLKASFE